MVDSRGKNIQVKGEKRRTDEEGRRGGKAGREINKAAGGLPYLIGVI